MPESLVPAIKSLRDDRLDLLRGICLLNMVFVHLVERGLVLPWIAHEVLMNWFRFAAGGFILTSGLCIGAIFYKRALDPARRWKAYKSIWMRAGVVLLVHYFSTFLSLLPAVAVERQVEDAPKMVTDVLHLWTGYDLLLFYVVMLAIAPLVIELVRRIGCWPVALLSVAVFFYRPDDPYLGLYTLEVDFPVLRWQLMFVLGIVAGAAMPRFDSLTVRTKNNLAVGGMVVAMLVAAVSAIDRDFGFELPWWAAVWKVPLTPLEAARYIGLTLALAIVVDRYVRPILRNVVGRGMVAVGSCSLLLWVAHVPIVSNLTSMNWVPAMVLSAVGVWMVARVAQWLNRLWSSRFSSLPRLSTVTPMVGSVVVVIILLNMQAPARYAMPLPRPPATVINATDSIDRATDASTADDSMIDSSISLGDEEPTDDDNTAQPITLEDETPDQA